MTPLQTGLGAVIAPRQTGLGAAMNYGESFDKATGSLRKKAKKRKHSMMGYTPFTEGTSFHNVGRKKASQFDRQGSQGGVG